ncbi:MAG: chorismate synthase [Ignavibacteriales bacterium CG_4_9_14_3_um_filter_34_10]|nr:MAG: chorismate synthase [Ignavibacteriales bacterium CG_4_9_14_3_um_filter_34_10]
MLRFLTAGESHGKGLISIIEGIPANLEINSNYINYHLSRRQMGYGRGGRMKIEKDSADIFSGIRFGKTTGAPISMLIKNNDWENWTEKMAVDFQIAEVEKITIPRPGHADLVGVSKYNLNDIRNSIERSSARETASRVAVGSVARKFLELFNIHVGSFVESIGGVYSKDNFAQILFDNIQPKNFNAWNLSKKADQSSVRVLETEHENKIIAKIKTAKKKGDTLGGTFFVIATGMPVGLGSFVQNDLRLDADIASAMISINAVKGVEIGSAFGNADKFGSLAHDEIIRNGKKIIRKTNRAGGIEGGISNGMPLIIRVAMKPIATLMSPIEAVDLSTMKSVISRRERSDFVAVPACAVIAESMLSLVLSKFMLIKFGGDSVQETMDNFNSYNDKLFDRVKSNFRKS